MRVYTYPGYVGLESAKIGSPKLFEFLEECGVKKFERHAWNGTINSLPEKPALIRASSMMECASHELAARCAELGHLCFYEDRVILPNGEYADSDVLIKEARKFLEKHGDEPEVSREQVISYLLSIPADRSTAGETTHALRQAKMLLDLFRAHVLRDDVVPSPEISGQYGVNHVPNLEEGGFGLDLKGLEDLKAQLEEDGEKASALPYDHPIPQAYFRKLAVGLDLNLLQLELAYEQTELCYALGDAGPNLGVLMETFRGRHSQWGGVAFLHHLMNVMRPPLIERLTTLEYPQSDEIVEWKYEKT